MRRMLLIAILSVALLGALSGCGRQEAQPEQPGRPTGAESPSSGPAAGSQLAPGLYDIADGKVNALGTLEYRDLEGGFYVITGLPKAEGEPGELLVVIANSQELKGTLEDLAGKQVSAVGVRQDGPSIRSAGPEMTVETISEVTGSSGPAE